MKPAHFGRKLIDDDVKLDPFPDGWEECWPLISTTVEGIAIKIPKITIEYRTSGGIHCWLPHHQ